MKIATAILLINSLIVNFACNQPIQENNSTPMSSKLNIDSLLNSPDTNKSIIEIDNYISKLCSYGERIEKLNEHQRVFFHNQELEREINNGGFNQYFFNSSGNFAKETITSLNEIGAYTTANILKEAIAQFPDGEVPKDQSKRRTILEQIEEKANPVWEQLDQRFYKYDDDLNALNFDYLSKHKGSL
jgi:hypothetical protein